MLGTHTVYKPLLGHRSSGIFFQKFQRSFVLLMVRAESNDRLKVVTQLFTRWWNRPTGVVLQGRASNHHKVLWWQPQGIERYGKGYAKSWSGRDNGDECK